MTGRPRLLQMLAGLPSGRIMLHMRADSRALCARSSPPCAAAATSTGTTARTAPGQGGTQWPPTKPRPCITSPGLLCRAAGPRSTGSPRQTGPDEFSGNVLRYRRHATSRPSVATGSPAGAALAPAAAGCWGGCWSAHAHGEHMSPRLAAPQLVLGGARGSPAELGPRVREWPARSGAWCSLHTYGACTPARVHAACNSGRPGVQEGGVSGQPGAPAAEPAGGQPAAGHPAGCRVGQGL